MKQCKNCGNRVNDEMKFCFNCGSAEFFVSQPQPQPQPQAPYFNAAQAQYNGSMQPPAKKNTPWMLIIIVVLVIAIAAAAIILIMNKKSDNSSNKEDSSVSEKADAGENTDDEIDAEAPTKPVQSNVPYTIGTFSGNTYINEWANLKVDIPEDWILESKLVESSGGGTAFSTANVDSNLNMYGLHIMFGNKSTAEFSTEEEFLESYYEDMVSDDPNATATDPARETIAGKSYLCITTTTTYGDGIDAYMKVCIKSIDDYYVVIMCYAMSESDLSIPLSLVQSAH